MPVDIDKIRSEARSAIAAAGDLKQLELQEIHFLGRKGVLTEFLRSLGSLPPEARKSKGEAANSLKQELEELIVKRREELMGSGAGKMAEREWIDVSAPGTALAAGHLHITTQAILEISEIFAHLGFNRRRYPEIDWDWYVFESLNMPPDHPARDEWETFFIDLPAHPRRGRMVLTTHTSNGQVREMERRELPIRMINISKCYRRQSDVTHIPMFHQFEGLLIDRQVSITHLKGTLDYFARSFFGSGRRTRLRPFHFRFTEPSFEVDISCGVCGGTGEIAEKSSSASLRGPDGSSVVRPSTPPSPSSPRLASEVFQQSRKIRCKVCKEGWLELGGAGMVHPKVLSAGGIDPKKWNGFAFGWGVERCALMKSGTRIDDIRTLYKNDLRFLEQF